MSSSPSPLAEAVARVGDRWTLLVVDSLLAGPKRFGELTEDVPGIAPNILTHRLRQLERDALIVAQPYSERPRRLSYELTERGRELAGALRALADWGSRDAGEDDVLRHAVCGTPVETRWYCPTCEEVVDESESTDLQYI